MKTLFANLSVHKQQQPSYLALLSYTELVLNMTAIFLGTWYMPPIFSVSAVSILRYYFPITQPAEATAKIFLCFLIKIKMGKRQANEEKEKKDNSFTIHG